MIIYKPANKININTLKSNCDNFIIQQVQKVKKSGIYIKNTLDQTPNINSIIQKVNFRSLVLSNIIKYANYKTRKVLYERIILSVFCYCTENLIDAKVRHINILNVLLNKCVYWVIGYRSYRMTTCSILKELNWLYVSQMGISQSL